MPRRSRDALLNLGEALGCPPDQIRRKRMSVHLLNIAQRREGPSAGLAIALAMLSAITGRPVRRELAVTGELSTHGYVTAIGGVGAKLRAAAERGRKIVILQRTRRTSARRRTCSIRSTSDSCARSRRPRPSRSCQTRPTDDRVAR